MLVRAHCLEGLPRLKALAAVGVNATNKLIHVTGRPHPLQHEPTRTAAQLRRLVAVRPAGAERTRACGSLSDPGQPLP
eukprot:CAMPEP_0168396530 /NCGR_PEP_ID=MMETSP0228-20121227/20597_1 /TAXON_ID=133427 /ORGANISM="Protoceratium reticulatum, Strain CCCM 535 (=CCMP 1889)" /LENGTH=77 /DNA_ID=CAMNT_0008409977 /DNA_START=297 /DNA_END=526 /DNA_ORIENTATION=+